MPPEAQDDLRAASSPLSKRRHETDGREAPGLTGGNHGFDRTGLARAERPPHGASRCPQERHARLAWWLCVAFVFAVPWENAIHVQNIGRISKALGLATLVVWAVSVVARGRLRQPGAFQKAYFLFLIWSGLSVFWSLDPSTSVRGFVTYTEIFGLMLILWDLCETETDVKTCLQAYVLGAYITCFSLLVSFFTAPPERFPGHQRFQALGFDRRDRAHPRDRRTGGLVSGREPGVASPSRRAHAQLRIRTVSSVRARADRDARCDDREHPDRAVRALVPSARARRDTCDRLDGAPRRHRGRHLDSAPRAALSHRDHDDDRRRRRRRAQRSVGYLERVHRRVSRAAAHGGRPRRTPGGDSDREGGAQHLRLRTGRDRDGRLPAPREPDRRRRPSGAAPAGLERLVLVHTARCGRYRGVSLSLEDSKSLWIFLSLAVASAAAAASKRRAVADREEQAVRRAQIAAEAR